MKEPQKFYSAIWLSGVFVLLTRFNSVLTYPLCSNMEAPTHISGNLTFCNAPAYKKNGCCTPNDDRAIEQVFQSMNISNPTCASKMKQILCVQCDAYSATLLGQVTSPESTMRAVPFLCTSNSTTSNKNVTDQGYCQAVWDSCRDVTIQNSPFVPIIGPGAPPPTSSFVASLSSLAVNNNSTLGSVFSTEADFCSGFGPSSTAEVADYCFSGGPFVPPSPPSNYSFPQDICLEKVGGDVFLNLIPHPDGSDRVAVTTQAGIVWLATAGGPGQSLVYNVSKPFLDLSDRVTNDNELGFLGFAFHPNFKDNGRFFVSYNCDKQQWADCGGTCACNPDTNCNPSDLEDVEVGGDDTSSPCRYSSIIAEYTVNITNSSVSPLLAEVANPVEVNRIFLMSLPYKTHHAGGLLFGPLDNYLYFMMGDGGGTGDPFNFAQNRKSLLGKIMRLDVDNLPSVTDISTQGLWGAYGIPPSNPFVGQNGSRPEIWALGLRNPWRCSFDSQYPTYFYCGDVGQDRVEEVDLISRGGNYGWRVYEGNLTYIPPLSPGGNTSAKSIKPIFPILEYFHPGNNPQQFSAAVTGGYVSYSREDPCLYGKYVYADLFTTMYVGAEVPKFSGNFRSQTVNYQCSVNSANNCTSNANSSTVNLQEILSFGVDNRNNLYILAGTGTYRIVNPTNCNNVCNELLPALPPSLSPAATLSPLLSPASAPGHNSAHTLRSSMDHYMLVVVFCHGLLAIMSFL
ncbi:unnamed protein product [Calypogeia fissa]